MDKILVTGGAGFIGSHFVKRLLACEDTAEVTVLDALTYAGQKENLADVLLSPKLSFICGNILDQPLVDELVQRHDAIVHFAAESHVDRSLFEAATFLTTNVLGTHTLLDAAGRHGVQKFVHVSTDEVYGPMATGCATESSLLNATVPYAASKAASDVMALSAFRTDGVPVCVTRSSNQYGPHQYPEKIIPLFVTNLLKGVPVTLHGRGQHVRNWLHVEDNCQGIELVLRSGIPGEVYNIGGGTDMTSKELTKLLLRMCGADWSSVTYIPDRKSNDIRYAMDWSKIADDLGYRPTWSLSDGLAQTVEWYRSHPERWAPAACDAGAPMAEINVIELAED
ncbi:MULTISPECIES: dTDP-glucose 4,6-dehydratase [unclassified Streptomyces]|uniref:dTDP-glucose 4,6-dehydratase n=1 Tax=unclassified Streptomyces TaxID=2593676 RepID=UPI0021C6D081|nr:dTDP-glucose 4,6-dehydratase [Streptomyces sp. FIT100]UUN29942.1 dTDP-glucose 4,6-dehydratase [Streptomyces sp. FIT100]